MYKNILKRALDFLISLVALLLIGWLLIIIAIWLHFANKGAGAFFFLKGQKKEIPVFTISYTSKEPSLKVLLNGLEAPVEKEEGIYKIKVDKGVNSSLTFKMAGYKDKKVDIDTSVDMSKGLLSELVLSALLYSTASE